jgi:NTE family protein
MRTVAFLRCLSLSVLWAALAPAHAHATDVDVARPKTCLVLSGGGARGIAHIGVLKVLEELHVPVDCVVGTSAGAIIGGAYAAGASPAEIEREIRAADWDRLLSDLPTRRERSAYAKDADRNHIGPAEIGQRGAGVVLPRGVLAGQHLQYYLQHLVGAVGDVSFDGLPIPFRALATDFETGQLVVLDHGDLPRALRASMSVPGVFAPVEIDGHVLVDGGLVRNIGVDVARSLGAERLIVVNVGAPLLRRAEIDSLLMSADQMFRILTNQNVEASLATLSPEDVLIEPDLGKLGSSEFPKGVDYIAAAETATRRAARELRSFGVDDTHYAAWREPRLTTHTDEVPARVVIDTSNLVHVPAREVEAVVGAPPFDAQRVVDALLATDDFQTVTGRITNEGDAPTLVLEPIEKPWGPDYLRAGIELASDFSGSSSFLVTGDQRMTWLDRRGLEWRNRASIGRINALHSELLEPLDAARRLFIAPEVDLHEQLRTLYSNGSAVASYRLRDMSGGVELGLRLDHLGEVRVGIDSGATNAILDIGSPVLQESRERRTQIRAKLRLDRIDDLDFPTQGYAVRSDLDLARSFLGGDLHYDRWSTEVSRAFGSHNASLLLTARVDTSLGTRLPAVQGFNLGGFQNLSGLREDQVLADRVSFLRATYRTRWLAGNPFVPGLYAGVSLEAADVSSPFDLTTPHRLYGGSLFVTANSALGPLYLGTGLANGGFVSVYLYLGRP